MPTYSLLTFGCQMNVHDSQRICEVLEGSGYRPHAANDSPDVVVLNTCSVRERGEQKLRSEVGRLAIRKAQNGAPLIVVAGCVAQQEGQALVKHMPSIDVVIGPDNLRELPGLLAAATLGGLPVVRTVFDLDDPVFLSAQPIRGQATAGAYVTIMKGCNERCSFCIVPTTRGPERYRNSKEIIDEIHRLVEAGTLEITLLGQTVNSYRDPSQQLDLAPLAHPEDPDESEFASLLRTIARQVPGLQRLRYTSPHPRHITPSLLAAHRDLEVLASHVHMPVQSGSNRVLKRMIRRYTREEYVRRVQALQEARPGLTLSTDVIVGFPGETVEEAEATVGLIREVGFCGVFAFKYSPRPGTPALRLPEEVAEEEKSRRLARIFEASEALLASHLVALVGTRARVLIEGESKHGTGSQMGRTERNEIVHLPATGHLNLLGTMVDVEIRRANKHSLIGELTVESQANLQPRPPLQTSRMLPLLPTG